MRIPFTKMQGAGNDFVVLDETRGRLGLSSAHYRFLGDRHFGVGADQILSVRASPQPGIDFEYVIHNADGGEVEQCGNGARCFARFVREKGLSAQDVLRVQTMKGAIELRLTPDGRVTVDMGAPVFELEQIPFNADGLQPESSGSWLFWPLAPEEQAGTAPIKIAVVSMGNPHAVALVDDVDTAPVSEQAALVQGSARFPQGVNVGFMQVQDRTHIRLRVVERGVGETLACGTGACAAVVAGIRLGLLDASVSVQTRGGLLQIAWDGGTASVLMTGPATTVFRGEIDIPDIPDISDFLTEKANEPTMTTSTNSALGNPLTEDDIADYLALNPDFFLRHAELLASVQLTSPYSHRTVGLQERQAELLREKIKSLEHRVMEMVRNGSDNAILSDKILRWARSLLIHNDLPALPTAIQEGIAHQFTVPQVGMRLWGMAAAYTGLGATREVSEDARIFASSLLEPFCGINTGFEAVNWLPDPSSVASLALIPLRSSGNPGAQPTPAFGLLVLASPDAHRFHSGMGTDFLSRIGELVSAAVSRLK